MACRYTFLVETFATELLKTLSVWAMAAPADLDRRPRDGDRRGRTLREHMVHQCQSEHGWFTNMFGIVAPGEVLPADRSKLGFLRHYAAAAEFRLRELAARDDTFWEAMAAFFGEPRPRTWIMTRRLAHTAHHRGQQTMLLRAFGRPLHSTYGPTADTGGLAKDRPPVVYPYADVATLLAGEAEGGQPAPLPPPVARAVTELPDADG
ncbi:MAG: damage-inducible protein DinB [Planctomycetes bacterium]|nr:damage-inducible protein DinB [Planctomycetota bacterium]